MRQVDEDYVEYTKNATEYKYYTNSSIDAFYSAWVIQNKRLINHQDKIDALIMTIQDNNPTQSQLQTLKELFPEKF